jgi:hypothetical protein
MDPFKWDLVKDIDGKTKVRILDELEDENNNPNEEVMLDEETLAVQHEEPLILEQEEENTINYPVSFQERKNVIEKFFKSELEWWIGTNNFIRKTIEENERLEKCYIQAGKDMNIYERYSKQYFYFTRSSIGRVHIQTTSKYQVDNYKSLLKEDPEWEKKRRKYWGDNAGATFIRKIIPSDEKLLTQKRIDSLNIIKGFPEFCWKFCMLSPEKYDELKEFTCRKYQLRRNYQEIVIPAMSLDERGRRSRTFYGVISTREVESHLDGIVKYYTNQEREAFLENGDIVKLVKKEVNRLEKLVPEWIFSPFFCWNQIPESHINLLKEINCMWDFYGKAIF